MGVEIKRGEVATSYEAIAQDLNLTASQVRTAIGHLRSTGEITAKTYPRFQVISIVNFAKYQGHAATGKITGKATGSTEPESQSERAVSDFDANDVSPSVTGSITPSSHPQTAKKLLSCAHGSENVSGNITGSTEPESPINRAVSDFDELNVTGSITPSSHPRLTLVSPSSQQSKKGKNVRREEGGSAPRPLSPSEMIPKDETPSERAERIRRLKE